ncbi:MAG: hypothetical protein H7X71_06085 [Chitinophagales bacterium]|nr:hypothetical protein [Chitinophagales bacterium]
MTTTQVNWVNIGLMIFSCIIAFFIPFELFLFSYAFLGPLHYLTEISWLHRRNYFTQGKKDYIFLVVLGILILLSSFLQQILGWFLPVNEDGTLKDVGLQNIVSKFDEISPTLIFLSFGAAMVMILVKNKTFKYLSYGLLFLLGLAMNSNEFYILLFAVFLPTLIHVFIFTGIFILLGALKGKSTSGYLSLLVFIACAISFFLLIPQSSYAVSDYARAAYDDSFFSLNYQVLYWFTPGMLQGIQSMDGLRDLIYKSTTGIIITRFIAFAYTYHYLNWFSKTSIIKWHEISKTGLGIIVLLWATALGLYAYDYKTGLTALYFLSFLHVLLEFPLNFQSFKQVGEQIKLRLSPSSKS